MQSSNEPSEFLRLDKLVRSAGVASRRELAQYIAQQRVTVDHTPATACAQRCRRDSCICIDRKPIVLQPDLYLMLHKPAGLLSATKSDLQPTVLSLLTQAYPDRQLFAVGRLDLDTEGLLLLTSDGDFCHRIIDPMQHIAKIYYARLRNPPQPDAAERFAQGLTIDNGAVCLPAQLTVLDQGSAALVTVTQGMHHQVKRMLMAVGSKVTYLKRLAIGGLVLDQALLPGQWRALSFAEQQAIFDPVTPHLPEDFF